MNLEEAVTIVVESKNAQGKVFHSAAVVLRSFCRHVRNVSLHDVRQHDVETFLDGPLTGLMTSRNKWFILRSFFEYWLVRQQIATLPMPEMRAAPMTTFIPYIYSRAEIARILDTIPKGHNRMLVDDETFRTVVRMLYGTGLLV